MNDDRRSNEASSLRNFFDEQIHHLHQLVGSLAGHGHEDEQQAEQDQRIVESFVDASNNKMRAVYGYSDKLREHVRALYNHVLQIADAIPPPVDLSREAFGKNPLVNALFVTGNDIEGLFKADPDVGDYFRAHPKSQVPVIYALLTAGKSEKRTLGIGMVGDMLVHDMPQEAVNFSSHKFHTLCASGEELSTALKQYLFGGIVALAKREMKSRMDDQLITRSGDYYESRINSLANPDIYLNTLIEYIEKPAELLCIDITHCKLSKLGIKLDSDDQQFANEFDIHELIWSDGSRNAVIPISHTR